MRQHGSIDGIITGIRGKDETIHITLQSEGQQISGIETNRTIAKQLGAKLFEPVRLFGRGRWARDADGNWSLVAFKVESFEGLRDVPLSTALEELRSIPTEWTDKSYGELGMIRHGPTGKRNGGHSRLPTLEEIARGRPLSLKTPKGASPTKGESKPG